MNTVERTERKGTEKQRAREMGKKGPYSAPSISCSVFRKPNSFSIPFTRVKPSSGREIGVKQGFTKACLVGVSGCAGESFFSPGLLLVFADRILRWMQSESNIVVISHHHHHYHGIPAETGDEMEQIVITSTERKTL